MVNFWLKFTHFKKIYIFTLYYIIQTISGIHVCVENHSGLFQLKLTICERYACQDSYGYKRVALWIIQNQVYI